VLAATGFIPVEWLPEWHSFDSPPGLHPDRNLVPGVEISSGSLGHGFPLGVGTALGLRAQGIHSRVVVLVGDAELDEGSNAEAIELAAALRLDSITVVAIDNQSSTYQQEGRIAARFAANGWHAVFGPFLAAGDGARPAMRRRRCGRTSPPSASTRPGSAGRSTDS